jgi:signal transduction histidine kinase
MNANTEFLLLGLALGGSSLALGWLFWRTARRWWRRRRYGEPVEHEALLLQYARPLTEAFNRTALAKLLVEEIPRAWPVRRAVLLLPDDYLLKDVMGSDAQLPTHHAAVRWVVSGGEAMSATRGKLRDWIAQSRADLGWTGAWVPLMRGVELRGIWLLGNRENGYDFSPEDLGCLTSLGRQAAVVLETLRNAEREQRAAAEIRALYQKLVSAQEAERGRFARDLHDGVLQDLCALSRDLKALDAQPETESERFADLAERSGGTVQTLRAICHDLRPPLLSSDLIAALKALIAQLDGRSGPFIHMTLSVGEVHLAEEISMAVFRIAQEALRNAIRHADASEIEVRLTSYPDRLRLAVADDGKGIPEGSDAGRFVAQGHFGLAGMRERAAMVGGTLDVQTAPDYGTVVTFDLPIDNT